MSEKAGGAFKCCMILGCLTVIIGGAVMGGLTYMGTKALQLTPEAVQANISKVLPGATVPAGYKGLMGMDIGMMRFSVVGPEDHTLETKSAEAPLLIALVDAKVATSDAELRDTAENNLNGMLPGPFVGGERKEVNLTIRGKPHPFTEVQGTSAEVEMKQLYAMVPSSAGMRAMVMFMGNKAKFDTAAMNAFLASITGDAPAAAGGGAAAEGGATSEGGEASEGDAAGGGKNPWAVCGVGSSFETKTVTEMNVGGNAMTSESVSKQTLTALNDSSATITVENTIQGNTTSTEMTIDFGAPAAGGDAAAPKPEVLEERDETITVGAGEFSCTYTKVKQDQAGQEMTIETWTAADLPVPVKQVMSSATMKSTAELVGVDKK